MEGDPVTFQPHEEAEKVRAPSNVMTCSARRH